jgi:hydroxymethylpyrimidine/phosphomethylpyrimidine kinase
MKKALTIAGSDSSGGAGIQADLKTFAAHGVYGMSVITAITAQNSLGVLAVQDIRPDIIAAQIEAIFEDMGTDAVKVGMVSQPETIRTIAAGLQKYAAPFVVIDPVMVSKSGYHLLQPEAEVVLVKELLPLATVVTPNIPEAEAIVGRTISTLTDMEEAARAIHAMGAKNVLLKGGHRTEDATDILFDGQVCQRLEAPRVPTKNTHGTGCTLSSAIAANLARGMSVEAAVVAAKRYITVVIQHALPIGKGVGPTHHFYELYQKAGLSDE